MMKIVKMTLVALILVGLVVSQFGCKSASDEAEALENQVVTVQRGDITIDVTAVGNLALSRTEDLSFEMGGTVEEVSVQEGDTVEEGEILAKLDISEWEDNLALLEDQVTAKERDLLQAEINVINAEITLENAEDAWLHTVSAGDAVRRAKDYLEYYNQYMASVATTPEEIEAWQLEIISANQALREAWDHFLSVASESEEVIVKEMGVELAKARLEDAQNTLQDAKEGLEEAISKSPEIKAPFAGFITMVNVEGGDEVMKGTVAVQLADPNKFEAYILVSEMDILQVKLGGEAWMEVDAMQGLSLPAKVTHISPTATIQQGVVNYRVKVEIESLEAVRQERQEVGREAMQEAVQKIMQGEMPERLKQAIEEGQITQEQAEEIMERMQQGQFGQQGQVPMQPGQGGQQVMPTLPLEDFQLREGLTLTVSIIVDERDDVLLVPNSAITSQRGQAYVQVVSPDGTTEERPVTTGLSDWQFTEVIDGLSEGEQVLVPQGSTTTTTTPQQGGGMPFFPRGR
jgi:HlyD family secretion protein